MRRSIVAATGLFIVLVLMFFRFMHPGNNEHWRKYFTESELAASQREVGNLIQQYRKSAMPDPELAKQIASHGAGAIPAVTYLLGEQIRLLIGGTHGGPVLFPIKQPYLMHSIRVMELIRDPASAPMLRKFTEDTFLGPPANADLLAIGNLNNNDIQALRNSRYSPQFSKRDLFLSRAMELPPDDAPRTLIALINDKNFGGAANVVTHGEKYQKETEELVEDLGKVPSQIACDYLAGATAGLTRQLTSAQAELATLGTNTFLTEEGRRKTREQVAKLPGYVEVNRRSAASCAKLMGL